MNYEYEFYSNCNSFVSNVIIIIILYTYIIIIITIIILMSKKAYCADVHAKRIKKQNKTYKKKI